MNKKNQINIMRFIISLSVLSLFLFFNNCKGKSTDALVLQSIADSNSQNSGGSSGSGGSGGAGTGATGTLCEQEIKNLYARGWHDFLKTNCAICHSNGPGKGRFANSELNLAYDEFMNVGYVKVGNNAVSSTHNPPYSGVHNTQKVNELKVEWQKGLQDFAKCNGTAVTPPPEALSDKITLKSIDKTIGLMNDGDKKVLVWTINSDVSRIKGEGGAPNIPNGKIALTVTRLKTSTGETYYTFSSPVVFDSSVDLNLKGLFININGFLLSYPTTFSFLDVNIRKGTKNDVSGIISTGSLVAPKVVLPTDVVSLSFIDMNQIVMPPPPAPKTIAIANPRVVIPAKGTAFVDVVLRLSSPAEEPVVVTLSENADLCGTASTFDNSNTLFKNLSSSCLPEVFAAICPSGTCGTDVTTFGRAKSVVGATWNRYDWDYKFPMNTVTFALGEQEKTLRVSLSRDVRYEKNRILTLDISAVLGSASIDTNKSINIVLNKYDNPQPNGSVLTFSELMNPKSGILGQNCVKCHNSKTNAGGYDMTDYEMMLTKKVLIPNDVNSKMYVRMHPTPEFLGKPMPQDGFLTAPLILEVEHWLMNGALNN